MLKLTVILIPIFLVIILLILFVQTSIPPTIYSPNISYPTIVSPTFIPTSTPIPTVSVGLVGDLGLGRFITANARSKNDFNFSFKKITPWLQQNDFNLANLESPVINNCPTVAHNTFKFCGDPQFLPQLSQNRFVLNLANNHIFNYGQSGFSETQTLLDSQSIPYFYSHTSDKEFYQYQLNGISFGFLGFDYITNPNLTNQTIINLVKKYDPVVDWLIVSVHWGNEYKQNPEKWRIDLAHLLIDNGADIIHGHHPHVWQAEEIYKDKPIFYSFGNFIFDQNWSKATSETNIVSLKLDKNSIIDIQKFPVEIKENCQPIITD